MLVETTVRQVLEQKGDVPVYSIGPDALVFDALRLMARFNIGALLVMHRGRIVGIVTERDYSRKVVLRDRSSRTTPVRDIMQRQVLYVTPDDAVEGCLVLMTEKRIRHLPVLDDGDLIGLISMGDVVKNVISDQEFVIDQLTHYITGSYAGWFDVMGAGRAVVEERFIIG